MQQQLALDWQHDPATGTVRVRLMATWTGTVVADEARVPVALGLVLDRSGSMAGEKLEAAKEAATMALQRLHPDDHAAVVAFDDAVTTVAEPATGREQAGLTAVIARIGAGGSTNLSGGWLRGTELIERFAGDGRTARILLLTDGQANAGIRDLPSLVGLCAAARARGITTSTIGFGAGYDEDLLKAMADAGGGNAWYIEAPDHAASVFATELGELQALCAQDLQVTLSVAPPAAGVSVLHEWPTQQVADGLKLSLGDLYAREPKVIVAEWVVPAHAARPDAVLGQVTVTAAVLTAAGVERQTTTTAITASFDAQSRVEPAIEREVLLAMAGRAQREAVERRDRGETGSAIELLESAAARYDAAAADDPAAADKAAELRRLAARIRESTYDELDRKFLKQSSYSSSRGKKAYHDEMVRRRRSQQPEP